VHWAGSAARRRPSPERNKLEGPRGPECSLLATGLCTRMWS